MVRLETTVVYTSQKLRLIFVSKSKDLKKNKKNKPKTQINPLTVS